MSGRTYGVLPVARWRDPEWLKLTFEAQRLYMYLASQPHINPAGVFLMQVDMWAKAGCDGSLERVQTAGRMLEERGFIAVDPDTGEGLLLPYIQDDDAHGKVFIGALTAAINTQSAALRYKLFERIQALRDSKTGQPRAFSEEGEQPLIEKLAATLEEPEASTRTRGTPRSPLPPSPAPPRVIDDHSKTVRRLFEDSSTRTTDEWSTPRDGTCLKCRQAQNLGNEARRNENPMWCGSCNFEAKEKQKWV